MPHIMMENVDVEPMFKVVRTKKETDCLRGFGLGHVGKVNGIKVGNYTSSEMSRTLSSKYEENQRKSEKLNDNKNQINEALIYLAECKKERHEL